MAAAIKYVDCFQLKRAFELPQWDLYRQASSVCARAQGRIKSRSTVLISVTDYDLGFSTKGSTAGADPPDIRGVVDICCILDANSAGVIFRCGQWLGFSSLEHRRVLHFHEAVVYSIVHTVSMKIPSG